MVMETASRNATGRGPRDALLRSWILLILVVLVLVAAGGFGVFGRVLEWLFLQPGLSIPLEILVLILYGFLGNSLGLSKLFLSPNPWTRFYGGLASALFVTLVRKAAVECQ